MSSPLPLGPESTLLEGDYVHTEFVHEESYLSENHLTTSKGSFADRVVLSRHEATIERYSDWPKFSEIIEAPLADDKDSLKQE